MATKPNSTNEQPANLTNIVIVSIVVSTVALIVLFIVGRIFIDQIVLKNKIIAADSKAEKQIVENIDAIHNLSQQYDTLGDKKKLIADALPTKPDFPALTSLMENLAKASGIRLQSVSAASSNSGATTATNPSPTANGVQPFSFTIAVQGSYTSIKSLLTNLEASAQPMRVSNITVGGTSDVLSVQLSITTYYQSANNLTTQTEVIR